MLNWLDWLMRSGLVGWSNLVPATLARHDAELDYSVMVDD